MRIHRRRPPRMRHAALIKKMPQGTSRMIIHKLSITDKTSYVKRDAAKFEKRPIACIDARA
jgi:hypothetical protein